MQFTKADLVAYFYIVGVAFAGVYLDRSMAEFDLVAVFLAAAVLSVPLTLYFKVTVLPKIEMMRGSTDSTST